MKIEYRYKWQSSCLSHHECENIQDIINWLKSFKNNTLEDYVEINNIEEIRILLKDSTVIVWIQMYKKIWGKWEVAMILNDSPIGSLFSFDDTILYLDKFYID